MRENARERERERERGRVLKTTVYSLPILDSLMMTRSIMIIKIDLPKIRTKTMVNL